MTYRDIGWRDASRYTRRHVYYRHSRTGELIRVERLRRVGPNVEVKLADRANEFLVARETRFYVRKGTHE